MWWVMAYGSDGGVLMLVKVLTKPKHLIKGEIKKKRETWRLEQDSNMHFLPFQGLCANHYTNQTH